MHQFEPVRAEVSKPSRGLFGLAALAGIAQVLGMTDLYAVHGFAQRHCEPKHESSCRNSRDEFWEKFSAERIRPEGWSFCRRCCC